MCDTFVIVENDRVLFGKNSDRDPNEAQGLEWHPAQEHRSGLEVRCTWITIPQAARTNAILICRPFWMWGAEMGANEHGVVVGNEAVFTRAKYRSRGLTGMDLVRLALERAASAREACEIVVSLIETHGQGGGCGYENENFTYHNSFIAADSREAFLLETAGQHTYIEQVLGRRSISNGLTIPSFANKFADRLRGKIALCEARCARTTHLMENVTEVLGCFQILRDHGERETGPKYRLSNGALGAPCVHAGGLLAAAQTTGSWVSELSRDAVRHWVTATAAPCTSIFKPVYVDQPTDFGKYPTAAPDDSLWWSHEQFHREVLRDPEMLLPLFAPERDALERNWVTELPHSGLAVAEHRARLAVWSFRIAEATQRRRARPRFVERYWAKRSKIFAYQS